MSPIKNNHCKNKNSMFIFYTYGKKQLYPKKNHGRRKKGKIQEVEIWNKMVEIYMNIK